MRYRLAPINTRPWLLNGLSLRLIESQDGDTPRGGLPVIARILIDQPAISWNIDEQHPS